MKFDFSLKRLFVLFFLYAFSVGLFVQLILLPHIFPSLHAGNGLLLGNDSVQVHASAVDLAQKMQEGGLKAHPALRPGKLMYSIVGVIYWLVTPTPLAVLPLQALAHSLSAFLLFLLFFNLTGNRLVSFFAASPYFFSLSALNIYTQLLKESVDNFGFYLFFISWTMLVLNLEKTKNWYWNILAIAFGQLICAYTKPYLMPLFWLFSISLILYVSVKLITESKKEFLRFIGFVLLVNFALYLLIPKFSNPSRPEVPQVQNATANWKNSIWLPAKMDQVLKMLSQSREGYLLEASGGSTSVDTDVHFYSAKDIFQYLPRAVQITFFSPFPSQWFSEGNLPGSSIMRKVGAVEAVVFYALILGLLYYLFACRPKIVVLFLLFFVVIVMLLQSTTIINIGTLVRHRFGCQSLLSGFGVLGLYYLTRRRQERIVLK